MTVRSTDPHVKHEQDRWPSVCSTLVDVSLIDDIVLSCQPRALAARFMCLCQYITSLLLAEVEVKQKSVTGNEKISVEVERTNAAGRQLHP